MSSAPAYYAAKAWLLGTRRAVGISCSSHWPRHSVCPITYVVSADRCFRDSVAAGQLHDLERLGEFLELPLFPIDFYSCVSTAEVMQIRGFEYHPLMYVHQTGGMAELDDRVLSGNDTEEYTHEIAHLFMQRAAPGSAYLLNEGLATLLGSS